MTQVFEIKESHYNLLSEASHFKRENVKSTATLRTKNMD